MCAFLLLGYPKTANGFPSETLTFSAAGAVPGIGLPHRAIHMAYAGMDTHVTWITWPELREISQVPPLIFLGTAANMLLVGGFNPSEKYWSIGMIIPNIWEN